MAFASRLKALRIQLTQAPAERDQNINVNEFYGFEFRFFEQNSKNRNSRRIKTYFLYQINYKFITVRTFKILKKWKLPTCENAMFRVIKIKTSTQLANNLTWYICY